MHNLPNERPVMQHMPTRGFVYVPIKQNEEGYNTHTGTPPSDDSSQLAKQGPQDKIRKLDKFRWPMGGVTFCPVSNTNWT